jgi:hypothetical protein
LSAVQAGAASAATARMVRATHSTPNQLMNFLRARALSCEGFGRSGRVSTRSLRNTGS